MYGIFVAVWEIKSTLALGCPNAQFSMAKCVRVDYVVDIIIIIIIMIIIIIITFIFHRQTIGIR
jgi:hypothetical protein